VRRQSVAVTVLMAVYNGEKHIKEAVASVLNQTFEEFEFLIIDDASNDSSMDIIRSFNEKRIKIIKNDRNIGLAASLNRGIKHSSAEYIARMDSDDICRRERLEKQIKHMRARRNVSICGSFVEPIGEGGKSVWKYPCKNDEIKCELLFNSAFAHPAVMIRRGDFIKHELFYNENFKRAQDFELWSRASFLVEMSNLPEVLLKYRIQEPVCGASSKKEEFADRVRAVSLKRLGIIAAKEELELHKTVGNWNFIENRRFIYDGCMWLLRLYYANKTFKLYPLRAFKNKLGSLIYGLINFGGERGLLKANDIKNMLLRCYEPLGYINALKIKIKSSIKYKNYNLTNGN